MNDEDALDVFYNGRFVGTVGNIDAFVKMLG